MTATWDVFHSDRLEVERALTTADVRAALARGDLRDDDLVRPAGTTDVWARLSDMPALLEPEPEPEFEPPAPAPEPELQFADFDDEEEDEASGSQVVLPVVASRDWDDDEEDEVADEDEEAAEFTLSRNDPERVEELDLAAMVDVAFQLVLFFLVTATTVLYKSLEVPKPNPESPAQAGAQQGRNADQLKDVYIMVDIDATGGMKIDREPIAAEMPALVERLRTAREKTGRKSMLLTADYATQHRNAVLAYDAANEIGLGIAIARPPPK